MQPILEQYQVTENHSPFLYYYKLCFLQLQGVTQSTGVRGFDEQMPICPTLTLYDVHSMGHTEEGKCK